MNASPDHAEGAFTNDLMDLVNVIEEDFLLIGHFFRRLEPGRQLGCCSLSGLPESCDTVCAVTQICALVLYPTDFEPPRPLTSWRPSLHFTILLKKQKLQFSDNFLLSLTSAVGSI